MEQLLDFSKEFNVTLLEQVVGALNTGTPAEVSLRCLSSISKAMTDMGGCAIASTSEYGADCAEGEQ